MNLCLRSFPTVLLVALPLMLAATAPARAQTDTVRSIVEELSMDQPLRLQVRGREEPLEGDLRFRDAGSLTLEVRDDEFRVVEHAAIERLWVPDANQATRGVLIGGLAGMVLGTLASTLVFSLGEGDPGIGFPDTALYFGVPAGFLGGGMGYLAGRDHPRWRLRFEAGRQ